MEPSEPDHLVIKRLLSRKSGPKLSHNAIFIFNLYAGKTVQIVEMSAEKVIISVGDKRFSQMFNSSVKPETETKSEVRVFAIEPQDFVNLLKFVYTGKLDLAHLHSTYSAAQHYALFDVCSGLMKFADSKLSIDNSAILLDQYWKIPSVPEQKIGELLGIIGLHTHLAVQSKQFLQISKSTLTRLLKSDRLFIQEKDLYYALMRWINAELDRQGLEANLTNKSKLFDEFKHLIRFPIMSKHQFFTAVRKNRFFFEAERTFEACPAQSGLFTSSELAEFERYFDTGDATLLSADYGAEERAAMKIGVLKLVRNEENQIEYQMFTSFDELHRRAEPRDDFEDCTLLNYLLSNCYLDADCYIEDMGDSYEFVYGLEYSIIKSKPVSARARRNNLTCSANSIRVFRIDVSGCSSNFEKGERLQIVENSNLLNLGYKRYSIDHTYGYYDYWPTVELKKGNFYNFEFVCPGSNDCLNDRAEITTVKLENVYTEDADGEPVLDVKLRIIGGLALWAYPTYIYFLYK